MNTEDFENLASDFPEIAVEPHFHKVSFRRKGKIYATLDSRSNLAVIKLTPSQQLEFCDTALEIIYPVKGKWGEKGWTEINIEKIHPELAKAILETAFENVK